MSGEAERAEQVRAENAVMVRENRVVTIVLMESEWLTAVDALHDRAEQTLELAGEVGDQDLIEAAHDYERVAQEIENALIGWGEV